MSDHLSPVGVRRGVGGGCGQHNDSGSQERGGRGGGSARMHAYSLRLCSLTVLE